LILADGDEVIVDRTALPRAARAIWFGRGLLQRIDEAQVRAVLDPKNRLSTPRFLIVAGEQSSKRRRFRYLDAPIMQPYDGA